MPKMIPKRPYRTRRNRDTVARLLCPKMPTIPLSLATYDRIDELSRPTMNELPCSLCDGVGLPKIEGTNLCICVVCRDALKDVPRAERGALLHNHEDYMWHGLPYFTRYLVVGRWETDDDQLNRIA
jgi:hypothetical protein